MSLSLSLSLSPIETGEVEPQIIIGQGIEIKNESVSNGHANPVDWAFFADGHHHNMLQAVSLVSRP